MEIHCAFCGQAFEKDLTPPYGEVECPSCHRTFDLSSRVTVPYPEADPGAVEGFPGKKYGGYRIEREIGRGGMGVVFEGVQESLDRKVAIKVLFRDSCKDQHFVARFEREAESLARLNHPNIVTILDRGCQDGFYYFVMEHVDGVSLRAMMDSGPLKPAQALAVIPALCDALEYAHREGVIHRDIKPENILVDRHGRVKIADFGLSRIIRGEEAADRITRSRMIMGTPDYMAPEQRENSKQVDHRADLFALGVVFYEMLTGELPLGKFPPPSKKSLQIDVRLDEIVLKVLDRDPDRRYQRASDIATDLARISPDNPQGKPAEGKIPVPEWSPSAGAAGQGRPAAPRIKGKRTFLEHLEDGWDSWVLALALVLTIFDFFPFVILLIVWGVMRKTVIARRASRLAGERAVPVDGAPRGRPDLPGAGARPGPGAVEVKVNRPGEKAADEHAGWTPVGPSAPVPPAPPAPPARGAGGALEAPAGGQAAPRPRTSFLAALSALYSLTLLGVFLGLFLPFQASLQAAYLALPLEIMPVALALSAAVALPGILGLLLSSIARSRISVHPHLGGSFLALLGLTGSVIFLGAAGKSWYDGYKLYRTWSDLSERAAEDDPSAFHELRQHAKSPARRSRALDAAQSLPLERAVEFFEWAAGEGGELGDKALRAWAGSRRLSEDPKSRGALLRLISEGLESPDPLRRGTATALLGILTGDDADALLLKAVSDKDAAVRRAAARALGRRRNPELVEVLLKLAVDQDEATALEALDAVADLEGKLPTEKIMEHLAAAMHVNASPALRKRAALRIKHLLSGEGFAGKKLEEYLKDSVEKGDGSLDEALRLIKEAMREELAREKTQREKRKEKEQSARD